VTCSATDAHNNTGTSSFNVDLTLVDTTPPVVGHVTDISDTTTSASGKTISYTKPTATDNLDGSLPVSCTKEPGANFPVGHTTVTCSATDAHNNTGTSSFNVDLTLVDTTPPVVNAPADRPPVEATGSGGATVTFPAATATDNIDGAIAAPCLPASGSVFPVGLTTVICTATDAHSNTGSDSFTVTVNDTTPPTVSITAPATGATVSGTTTAPPPCSK